MPKNIVICCDGTGNEINNTISNVLKLFRVLKKDDTQRVYYHPGIGTIGLQSTWGRFKQELSAIFQLATGAGLDEDLLAAYRFLCETYQAGDKVWLFGFSRGAYTVRVLAGFIQVIGLLPRDQLDLAPYAFSTYKKVSAKSSHSDAGSNEFLEEAWQFSRIAGGYHVPIEFMGVWDTVSSVIVPGRVSLQTLAYTRKNPSVKTFRHAISIDERRRMFRINRWLPGQKFRSNIFDPSCEVDQDIREVWFAGVHCDVGGGYKEVESGESKFPLLWMIDQAKPAGLAVDDAAVDHLCWGRPAKPPSPHSYTPPSDTAPLHNSLTWAWWLLEWWPKSVKWRDWPERKSLFGFYLPLGEPRFISPGSIIHESVFGRIRNDPPYNPINLPTTYATEPNPVPPP